jgi:tryptophan-rich sensory protein
MSRLRQILGLVAFLAIAYAVAVLGSVATISQVEGWYAEADKVPWNPPSVVFGPVWTVLYTLMAVAAWLVWRRRERTDVRRPLTLYVIQLVVNAVWTPVFFGLYPVIGVAALWIAVAIIVALDVLVLLTLRSFWPVHRAAALLLVPYAAWVLFATTLTIGIAVLQS